MRQKRIIYLLTIGLILSIGGVSFAKETKTDASLSSVFTQNYDLPAVASVVSAEYAVSFVAMSEIKLITDAAVIYSYVNSAAEVLDPGRWHSYNSDYKNVPTPNIKTLKAKRLIRLILRHPSNI